MKLKKKLSELRTNYIEMEFVVGFCIVIAHEKSQYFTFS